MKINIYKYKNVIKPLFWLTSFFNDNKVILVCKGYGEDWDYYTGLYWQEDKNINFKEYDDFQLWLNF